jgi:hydrogenase maturation protein HypF
MDPVEKQNRIRIAIHGTVQGVGFRPFVYRLASELGLTGWIRNDTGGVTIEVEGPPGQTGDFLSRVDTDKPPHSVFYSLEHVELDATGAGEFEIRPSDITGPTTAVVLPDIATCPDCLAEILDPVNRRYRYPFTNCTHCGPRFTIITSLPYDRANTTMRRFEMCETCRAEYENPRDRRYHAQPNACPQCGPQLEWWDGGEHALAAGDEALRAAAETIRCGRVAAVKGLGGFQLLVDARNDDAVDRLRRRKHRDEKPFAVMAPSVDWVRDHCELSEKEARLLLSPESPIVLLRRRANAGPQGAAASVAPANPYLGVMVPYTPLHHLLLDDLGFAVVATSGNVSEEPICIDEREARDTLAMIADGFLVHNRPIARHADDSVSRVAAGRELVLRRARGYAPLPLPLTGVGDGETVLGVGAYQKNAVGLSVGGRVVLGQHVGDLSTLSARTAFERCASDLQMLYGRTAGHLACDLHPDYASTRYARSLSPDAIRVQHHFAHVVSCAVENGLTGPVLGVSWDGTGYGDDGTVWGGEFLRVDASDPRGYDRAAHLRTFRLPGGDRAVREPRRSALGLLYEISGGRPRVLPEAIRNAFSEEELRVVYGMLDRGVNSPVTSSAGRLFDAVASILGIRHNTSFEGQAAMELEFAAHRSDTAESLPFAVDTTVSRPWVIDWEPAVRVILSAVPAEDAAPVAAAFHNGLAAAIVSVAGASGLGQIVLSGGCFQNARLLETTVERLRGAGLRPFWHQRVPPNDGGIALGQIAAAHAIINNEDGA